METDLFELCKEKTTPTWISISPNGSRFVVSATDCYVRVFDFKTGKLKRKYDETLKSLEARYKAGETFGLEAIDFGRRVAFEKEYLSQILSVPASNAIFDNSGNFIILPTLLGIKIINLVTNKTVKLLGRVVGSYSLRNIIITRKFLLNRRALNVSLRSVCTKEHRRRITKCSMLWVAPTRNPQKRGKSKQGSPEVTLPWCALRSTKSDFTCFLSESRPNR